MDQPKELQILLLIYYNRHRFFDNDPFLNSFLRTTHLLEGQAKKILYYILSSIE